MEIATVDSGLSFSSETNSEHIVNHKKVSIHYDKDETFKKCT